MVSLMKDQPLVSIIIPVYNGANYLCEAIDSALAQTYKNIEILVVNDGSADGGATEKIVMSYGNKIRYFYKQNGGVASALNRGIQEMTGEYFSWLSHDDVYYPDKVEVQVNFLSNRDNKTIILYSDFDIIDENSRILETRIKGKFKPDFFCIALILSNPLHGCDALVPKRCFEQVGMFNEEMITTNDYDMWFKLALNYQFFHIPQSLIKGRKHKECDSVIKRKLQIEETDNINIYMLDKVGKQQIIKFSNNHLGIFYLKCAFSFAYRQTCTSCYYALRKSFQYIYEDNILNIVCHHAQVFYLYIKLFIVYIILLKNKKNFPINTEG
ncbi:MAG: glycosyltransferase [Chitinophagaceae bacterium]|nr:glycosyltransferase [Chitinophagaceae bacterium]